MFLCCHVQRLHIHFSLSTGFSAYLEPSPAETVRRRHGVLVAYSQSIADRIGTLPYLSSADPRLADLALRGLLDLCEDAANEVERRHRQRDPAQGSEAADHRNTVCRRLQTDARIVQPKRKEMQQAMRGFSESQLHRLVAAVLVELEKRVPMLHEGAVEIGGTEAKKLETIEEEGDVVRHKDLGKLMGAGI